MNQIIALIVTASMTVGIEVTVAHGQARADTAAAVYQALASDQRCTGRGIRSGHDELVVVLETASLNSMGLSQYPGWSFRSRLAGVTRRAGSAI
jgi:hypothetical protein